MELNEYRKRRAKKGFGTLKKELIKELAIVDHCYQLSFILCLHPETCPKEWLDQKEKFTKERAELKHKLEEILL